ncbi:hypothetical protein BKA70DRAFT_855389 [Coprinopsis sp. MPI-PUGE-AT-0042]|nr:hypothetical protein BKA70DRAFT_855389 [Coprinopsis sp. MPI-PUGE-AT-0042]
MEVSTLPLLADSEDPTSLRARALSTLKLKRKRPVPKQPKAAVSLPARPIPSRDAFQLDYGNEDSSASQAQPAAGDEKIAADVPEPDASIREEGEISEEDEPPAKPLPIRRPTPTGPRKHREIEAKLSLLDRISDPAPEHIPPRTPVQIFTQPSFQPSPRPPQRPRISPDQVRPNIPLNQSDYDKAKDVILEILGWGVPPEYLVDCGITREMVFYAFSEFNLRRPANLDTTGLIPYTPETIREFIVSQNVGAPNGSSIQPQLPSLSFGSSSTTSTSAPPTPQPQDDLSDMERQRKQELIARKAVLASRKRKTVPPAAPQPPSTRKASPVVHEAIVDDFLKTITPTSESKSPIPGTPPMDVDHPSTEIPLPVDSDLVSKPASPSPEPPPTSTESTTSIFTIPIRSSPEPWTPIDTPKLSAHLPFVPQYPPRRSAKRPVASDFVDAEAFGGHRAGSLGHAQHTNSFVRRKTGNGSFVNVRHTKCVIDLSDTESEAEDDESPFGLPTSGAGVNALSAAPTSVSQALLEKKEREIQRMKDLIAQHEQKSRLKKMTPKVESVKPSPSPSIDASAPVSRTPIASSPTTEDQNPPETPLAAFREPASRL